jgi:hypothetical protein
MATGLASYLENGIFVGTSILLGFNFASVNYISESIVVMTLGPALAMRQQQMESRTRRIHITMWLIRLVLVSVGVMLAALSDTDYFNYGVLATFSVIIVLGVLSAVIQLKYLNQLIALIEKTADSSAVGETQHEELGKVMARLLKARRSLIINMFLIIASNVIVLGLFVGLGEQLPYAWGIWPMLFSQQFGKYFV